MVSSVNSLQREKISRRSENFFLQNMTQKSRWALILQQANKLWTTPICLELSSAGWQYPSSVSDLGPQQVCSYTVLSLEDFLYEN